MAVTVPMTKEAVCAAVRATRDGEDRWQQLQGEAYGPRIVEADPMPGVRGAVEAIAREGLRLVVVSHKTRLATRSDGTDLRGAALRWLDRSGLFVAGLRPDHVHFTDTTEAKVSQIGELGCRWFVDDKPEILTAPRFPAGTEPLLFASTGSDTPATVQCLPTWEDVTRYVLGRHA